MGLINVKWKGASLKQDASNRLVTDKEKTIWNNKANNSHTHTKSEVGLGNVDNTADSTKSVKYATSAGSTSNVIDVGVGSADTSRHVWFSNTNPETSRVYSDKFQYNPATDVLTVGSITGSAGSVAWGNVSGRPSSLPASDVYAWAKASTKPSYSWNEIASKPSTFTPSSHTHNYAGSSSAGGSANSAVKLNSNAGSKLNPIYFSDGKPAACTYTLAKSVPSDAVFTDTNTWRGIQNNLTSNSTSDSLSAAQGKVLKGLIDGKASSSHTHSYLPLSGGNVTGRITRSSGGAWISQRDLAIVYQSFTDSSSACPVVAFKTKSGAWAMGSLAGTDNLYFSYSTDSDYNAGNNNANMISLPAKTGTIALTSDIPTWDSIKPYTAFFGGISLDTNGAYIYGESNSGNIFFRYKSSPGATDYSWANLNDIVNNAYGNLRLSGGTITGNILPSKNNSYYLGKENSAFYQITGQNIYAQYLKPINNTSTIGVYTDPWNAGHFESLRSGTISCSKVSFFPSGQNKTLFPDTYLSMNCLTNSSDSKSYGIINFYYDKNIVSLQPTIGSNARSIFLPNASGTLQISSSDIRLKDNVKDSNINALEFINKIKIRQFDWKESGKGHQDIGFIADELEELDSNLSVGGGTDISEYKNENGKCIKKEIMNVKCVNTFYLQGYEVKAIQELSSKVDNKVDALEKENNKLKDIINQLFEKVTRLENK